MLIVDKYILPPSPEHFLILKYILILMLMIHLPFVSMLIGGTFFSVVFNILDRKKQNRIYLNFANDLIDTVAVNRSVGFILGVVPMLVVTLIYTQILYTVNVSAVNFLIYSLILLLLGFTSLYFYKYTFHLREAVFGVHIFSGILGIIFFLAAYFIFSISFSLLLDPGEWRFVKNPVELISYWNAVSMYLYFIVSSLAITGGGILFFFFHWSERKIDHDSEYSGFIKNFGLILALIFTLLQPVLCLWNLATLPEIAISQEVFGFSAIALFLSLVISYMLCAMLKNPEKKLGVHIFSLFLLTFLITALNDQATFYNAIKEHIIIMTARAEGLSSELKIRELTGAAEEAQVNVKKGEMVFNSICSACHSFDRRAVGPPFKMVLPKYQNKEDELKTFVRNPSKKNPGYPSMPKLGLKEDEIASVAAYLLQRLQTESQKQDISK